jgi:acyl-ACP thioesterase
VRDYDILSKDEKPAVSARSSWVIVDKEKRRPLRPQYVMDMMPLNEGLDALPLARGLEDRDFSLRDEKENRLARYGDVDYNGHVNNVSYIRWIEEMLEPWFLEKAKRIKIDINYLSEVMLGQKLSLFMKDISAPSKNGNEFAFAFEGKKESASAFRAELSLYH